MRPQRQTQSVSDDDITATDMQLREVKEFFENEIQNAVTNIVQPLLEMVSGVLDRVLSGSRKTEQM